MTARWVRILSATGPESTPLDEAARQISEIGRVSNAPGRFGRPKRQPLPATAETIPDRVLARQLIAGVLVSDFLVSQLCAATGQTREQLLGQLDGSLPPVGDRQLDALLLELSRSCALLQDQERPTYVALGSRIEQLLKHAEEQSAALVEAAGRGRPHRLRGGSWSLRQLRFTSAS